MDRPRAVTDLTRRDLLRGAAALAVGGPATAEASRRGGVFRIGMGDPPHFDPHLTAQWSTQVALSFTHSRLLRHRAGPEVAPGTFAIEGDLAESWSQTDDTTYVFKLRRDVRWHAKPPVGGRELTADDVKYTFDRFLGVSGNPNRILLDEVERVDVLDRHTIRFTLRAPYAWFLDALASTAAWIIAPEAVAAHGDLKRPETCIGTGPWVLADYQPNVRLHWVRHPHYFRAGLPYADGVEASMARDTASGLARWLSGQLDFAPALGMMVRRLDLDVVRRRKPGLQTAELLWTVGPFGAMKLDRAPFKDIRVRRALALATNIREILATSPVALGHGVANPAVPAALVEWSIPLDQLSPLGRQLYEHDAIAAARLLAEAGHAGGLTIPVESAPFGPEWTDGIQGWLAGWKAAGIKGDLKLKEVGAFMASAMLGRFDTMMLGNRGGALFPDPYLTAFHVPGVPTNSSGVDDPKLTELIRLQRRTLDPAKRRDILWDIQRSLAEQVYYLYGPSHKIVAGWDAHVRNFAPNVGNDYGGRLVAAWLDR